MKKTKQKELEIELSPAEKAAKEDLDNRLKLSKFVKTQFKKRGGKWALNFVEYLENNKAINLPEGIQLERSQAARVARDAYLAELTDLKLKKEMGAGK